MQNTAIYGIFFIINVRVAILEISFRKRIVIFLIHQTTSQRKVAVNEGVFFKTLRSAVTMPLTDSQVLRKRSSNQHLHEQLLLFAGQIF
jgi:hypothetical protein